MKPNWMDAPAWANWLAMDASGVWHWFQQQPRCDAQHFRAMEGFSQIADRSPKSKTWTPYLEARPSDFPRHRASPAGEDEEHLTPLA